MVKQDLTKEQILARRRNEKILKADIVDLEMEINDSQYMLDNNVPETRIRRQIAIASNKKDMCEQNLKIISKELREGKVDLPDMPAPQ